MIQSIVTQRTWSPLTNGSYHFSLALVGGCVYLGLIVHFVAVGLTDHIWDSALLFLDMLREVDMLKWIPASKCHSGSKYITWAAGLTSSVQRVAGTNPPLNRVEEGFRWCGQGKKGANLFCVCCAVVAKKSTMKVNERRGNANACRNCAFRVDSSETHMAVNFSKPKWSL